MGVEIPGLAPLMMIERPAGQMFSQVPLCGFFLAVRAADG
jgi:hypothetical protein